MKLRRIVCVSAVALGLLSQGGCASRPGLSYTVHVSNQFTPDQQEAVIGAAETWVTSVSSVQGRLELSFVVDTDPSCAYEDSSICVLRRPDADIVAEAKRPGDSDAGIGVTYWSYDGDWANVWIGQSIVDTKMLRQVALHELGHAFALDHDIAGTLMCGGPTIGCQADHPTAKDVAQFWGFRREQ